MSRLSVSLLVSVMLVGTTAGADTFGGWTYTVPPGFTVETAPDHVALTKLTGATFCSIAVFEARALDRPVREERAFEWQNVVAHTFTASVKARATMQTKHGVNVDATTAKLVDADGNEYAGVHYTVMPPGMIGSVLATSSTPASLRACQRVAAQVVGSLAIDWTSPRFTDPEARVESPEGRWAVAGGTSREYTFSADGTYRFHSETSSAERDRIVDESGRYTVVGNQLTLTPVRATNALVERGIVRPTTPLRLEKATYTWGRQYQVDTNEWHLVLTPKKATTRDGQPRTKTGGYPYSDRVKPAWKYATQPGV